MPRPFGWRLDNFRTASADDAMQLTVFAPRAGATCLVDGLAEMRTDAGITRTLVAETRLSLGVRIAGAAHRWQGARVTLTELAIEAGYYDQSHFVREIRLATGQAPNRLLGSQNWC